MQKLLHPTHILRYKVAQAWRLILLICTIGAPEQIIQHFDIRTDTEELGCQLGTDPVSGKAALVFKGTDGYVTVNSTHGYSYVQSITIEGSSSADGTESMSKAVLIERVQVGDVDYYAGEDVKANSFYPYGSYNKW